MTRYVCGFCFSSDDPLASGIDPDRRVVLIRKARPAWQAGKLNGVGGKIEDGETPTQAMRREFREETGRDHATWVHFATLTGPDWTVYFFRTFSSALHVEPVRLVQTDEPIEYVRVSEIAQHPTIPNLRWLVPLALDDAIAHGHESVIGGFR